MTLQYHHEAGTEVATSRRGVTSQHCICEMGQLHFSFPGHSEDWMWPRSIWFWITHRKIFLKQPHTDLSLSTLYSCPAVSLQVVMKLLFIFLLSHKHNSRSITWAMSWIEEKKLESFSESRTFLWVSLRSKQSRHKLVLVLMHKIQRKEQEQFALGI